MFDYIRQDLQRFRKPPITDRALWLPWLLWYSPGLKALLVYRLGRWLAAPNQPPWRRPLSRLLKPLYRLLASYYRAAYDIELDLSARIGPGLYVGHFGGIRVRECRIGHCCSIQQEVRLEPAYPGGAGPTIGDGVWIGAQVRILGEFRVGERATIGAGAVLAKDAPPGALMLGNPAKVVLASYDNSSFL